MHLPYAFVGPLIDRLDGRGLMCAHVLLPGDLRPHLPLDAHPQLRVEAEIDGISHEGTFMPQPNGRHAMMVARRLLRETGRSVGDEVHVAFAVADQDAVRVHPAIRELLEEDEALRAAWDDMTPGRRRGWTARIGRLKSVEARRRNLDVLVFDLLG